MRTILLLLTLASFAWAEPGAKLSWDYDTTAMPDVAKFTIYLGSASGNYTETIEVLPPFDTTTASEVTSTLYRVVRPGATYFVAVTASNAEGVESQYSNEISFRMPGKPVNLRKGQ